MSNLVPRVKGNEDAGYRRAELWMIHSPKWYLTLSVFWVPKALGIWVRAGLHKTRGYPNHSDDGN